MSQRDQNNLSNSHPNPQEGNKRDLKGIISCITAIMIATAIGSSVLTVVALQRMGLIVGNNPVSSPSVTDSASPTPSVSPTISTSPTPSVSPTVAQSPTVSISPTPSASPTPSPSPTSPPASPSSIFDAQCLSATPGYESVLVKNSEPPQIIVAQEVLPEIGYFYSGKDSDGNYVGTAVVSCILDAKFQQLNLVVGMDSRDPRAVNNRTITVEMRLDGELKQTSTVTLDAQQKMSVNLQNVRSLGIKAICSSSVYYCPRLSILETSLK